MRTMLQLRRREQRQCFYTVRKVEVCARNVSVTTLRAESVLLLSAYGESMYAQRFQYDIACKKTMLLHYG